LKQPRSRIPIPALVIAGLTVAIALSGLLLHQGGFPQDLTGVMTTVFSLIGIFSFLAFSAMGLLLVRSRPHNAVGWLLLGIGLNVYLIFNSANYAELAIVEHRAPLLLGQVFAVAAGTVWIPFVLMLLLFLPMLFPDGRLLSRRWIIPIVSGLIFATFALVGNLFLAGKVSSDYPGVTNPLANASLGHMLQPFVDRSVPFGLFALVGSVSSVVVRYRRGDSLQRHQLRWFLFALILAALPFLLNNNTLLANVLLVLFVPLLPISIAIAVLRYRLYDIDVVINRTLVYGALAAFITAVYVAIVVGLGALINSGGRPNLALSILATAVVAVAFQPVRTRVQMLANRLIYGYRATPYEALTTFSHRVAGTYANEDVLPRLAQVLADGTGATVTSVWISRAGEPFAAATWPETAAPLGVAEADRVAEVRHLGETLGTLTVRKRAGEPLTPVEEKLLNDLAAQAGQVLRNVRLTAELQARLDEISSQALELRASRQRIVAVQDAERRRLERNIHDGAQQHLVALAVKLRLAATMAKRDPAKARRSLTELVAQTAEARRTVGDLAQGIYPPALREGGLVEALQRHAEVSADGIARYDPEIEAGVYFACLEALQNATKYAGAAKIRVDLRQRDGQLLFSVVDDGVGFDPWTASTGTGLQNMKDRIASLGGRLVLESQRGKGTIVSGSLPLPSQQAGEGRELLEQSAGDGQFVRAENRL
jgi:signal transduction histidine kinase